jgi:hypothetical protein
MPSESTAAVYDVSVRTHSGTWSAKAPTPRRAVSWVGGMFVALGRPLPDALADPDFPELLEAEGKYLRDFNGIEISVTRIS